MGWVRAGLEGVIHGLARLPEPVARWLGCSAGWGLGSVLRYRRREALESLGRAFPDWPVDRHHRVLREMYRNLGLMAFETLRLCRASPDDVRSRIEWAGREHLDRALALGRGALVLSAHTGSWELAIISLPLFGYRAGVVVKTFRHPDVTACVNHLRKRFGLEVFPARGAYRTCLRALRSQMLLAFVLDQNVIDKEGVFVEFFGRPACTSPGLAHLSAMAKAPVVPIFVERLADGRQRFHVHEPLPPPPNWQPEVLREATQHYTRLIEEFIREHPEQWIWIHRRWRTQLPRAHPGLWTAGG